MKNVLVVYFTQSGQLAQIAQNIAKPLVDDPGINVIFHEIKMVHPFPFPWDSESFFDVFPESFQQIPAPIHPVPQEILNIKFDIVLLHYQVWYLSPSIPTTSFLKSADAAILLDNTPVVTINGSRNMWFQAQEKVKALLRANGALLKGNIAMVDRAGNLISVITIVKWMYSGKKEKYLGIFPKPGVSEAEINSAGKFGFAIAKALHAASYDGLQDELLRLDAVRIRPFLLTVDKTGSKIFTKWSVIILKKSGIRKKLLKVFVVYLALAIWLISPIVFILYLIKYPFIQGKIKKQVAYYKGV
ncbi:dialkylrecorsinol condensing enzyme DarA [Flavobacterium rhizosphaerae]|uniref:Dialkylresorcinol condensing enzyme DarA n=1 Tax=Flavobacterium rhizosphaerae TaxID=3163298 RepID=A0ABW8YZU0_9FLAO